MFVITSVNFKYAYFLTLFFSGCTMGIFPLAPYFLRNASPRKEFWCYLSPLLWLPLATPLAARRRVRNSAHRVRYSAHHVRYSAHHVQPGIYRGITQIMLYNMLFY